MKSNQVNSNESKSVGWNCNLDRFDVDYEENVATSSLGRRVIAKRPRGHWRCGVSLLVADCSNELFFFCILHIANAKFSLIKSDQSRPIRKRVVAARGRWKSQTTLNLNCWLEVAA